MEVVRIGLVGVGGYAARYVQCIRALEAEGVLRLASAVIRSPEKHPDEAARLRADGVPIRASLREMLDRDAPDLDLVALPTGISSHREQMIACVEAGLPVVLEKPSAATIQDLDAMEEALRRSGRFCQVGFQSQSDAVVLALKRALCAGRLGAIREVVATGLWKRADSYYARTPWAGAFVHEGQYVLDGTVNNPLAHYLFNGFFFASTEEGRAAAPTEVRAELYHAHAIPSEDTSCLEARCDNGATVRFYATLCAGTERPAEISILGARGRAHWSGAGWARIEPDDGPAMELGAPDRDASRVELFRNAARFLRGLDARLNCPLVLTRAHVLAVNGAFESARTPIGIPAEHVEMFREETGGRQEVFPRIREIEAIIERAAREGKLFSDLGVPWARATKPFSLRGYARFAVPPPA